MWWRTDPILSVSGFIVTLITITFYIIIRLGRFVRAKLVATWNFVLVRVTCKSGSFCRPAVSRPKKTKRRPTFQPCRNEEAEEQRGFKEISLKAKGAAIQPSGTHQAVGTEQPATYTEGCGTGTTARFTKELFQQSDLRGHHC